VRHRQDRRSVEATTLSRTHGLLPAAIQPYVALVCRSNCLQTVIYVFAQYVHRSRRDRKLSWSCWLTHSGPPDIVSTEWSPAYRNISGTGQRKSALPKIDVLTSELRRKPLNGCAVLVIFFGCCINLFLNYASESNCRRRFCLRNDIIYSARRVQAPLIYRLQLPLSGCTSNSVPFVKPKSRFASASKMTCIVSGGALNFTHSVVGHYAQWGGDGRGGLLRIGSSLADKLVNKMLYHLCMNV